MVALSHDKVSFLLICPMDSVMWLYGEPRKAGLPQGDRRGMPHDRGTPPTSPAPFKRGLAGGADQQPIWAEPTAPAARRPPRRPRERRPALAALAVLLILGGALAAGFPVLQSGKRVPAIEISAPVGAGQRIPLNAMQQVQIAAGTGLDYVPWAEA